MRILERWRSFIIWLKLQEIYAMFDFREWTKFEYYTIDNNKFIKIDNGEQIQILTK